MLFTADSHAGLADGSITVTFRAWKRPQAKVGGRYTVGPVTIEVEQIDRIAPGAITNVDARRAGSADRAGVLARLGELEGREIFRIQFHRVVDPGLNPLTALAARSDLSDAEVSAVAARLDRLDRASSEGSWTRAALDLIGDNPGLVSTDLAASLGRERFAFKADVRKLKALGLTESLRIGYRLSPRGEAVRAALNRSA